MATSFIGKSVAPSIDKLYPYQINTTGLKEGAAVVYDSSAAGNLVKAPAAAAAQGFAGLIATKYAAGGATVVGQDVDLQRTGIGMGILIASQAVTVGQELVIADTAGTLRPFALGSDDDCDIVGTAEQTLGSVANVQNIRVNLDSARSVHKDAS